MLKIYNTLSRKIEEFKPLKDKEVGLYTCGPTVYDYAHIGNFRTYIFEDLLKRVLLYDGFEVKHVMNITDVDDKTIKASNGNKKEFAKLTKDFENKFFEDLKSLNIIKPDVITNATKYIEKMADFIQELINKGFAYKAIDGSVYFKIEKFKDYGKLAKLDKSGLKVGARVKHDNYEKENLSDFVLWKSYDQDDGEIYWETKLGKGRPGWHIECSTMAQDILGDTLDIHAGAIDLIFPHHENEIAQAEAKTDKPFANYFIHGEHLLVDNAKMSKSLHNFYTLKDLEKEFFSPLDFRYLCLQAHYRTKLNFNWSGLKSAKNSLNKLCERIKDFKDSGEISKEYKEKFLEAINNDLDMPKALTIVWELLKSGLDDSDKKATLIDFDKVLGLNLNKVDEIIIPEEVLKLVKERENARKNKDWQKADELRKEIIKLGYEVEDTEKGSKILKY
ncbi:MAG: cysteine--tRNA ligase [Patescibacteria group bacterium]|nr:cysteine--tRNA ligase [Patescibacteria group bacterium]